MTAEDKTTLSAAQVEAVLLTLEGWSRSEAVLARTFVFPHVSEITAFLTHLVRTMTEQQRPPDFSLNTGLKMASVALTRADLQFARALNAWQGSPAREASLVPKGYLPSRRHYRYKKDQ